MIQYPFSRRRFVQLSAGSLAATCLASPVFGAESLPRKAMGMPMPGRALPDSPQPPPNEDSVGFAVMGLGGYGIGQVLPALARAKRCHIAAVVSGNPDKAARVAAAYGIPESGIYSYENFDEIANNPAVEAVYNVLPSGLHADWVEKTFAAGKHVLCEKPMALSVDECQRMINASGTAGKKLMIGYRCHFEPFNLQAMQLMRDKAIGKIRHIETMQAYMMGPTSPVDNWRVVRSLAGGGPLEDYGIYGLQSALYLGGEMPSTIRAVTEQPAGDVRFSEIFASVRTEMHFPSGSTANLYTSYNEPNGANRVVVTGDAGELHMEPATSYSGNRMSLTRGGEKQELNPGDSTEQFYLQCDHLADAIRDGTEIIAPGEMGLRDVRLMEAIYESATNGSTVTL